jgi:hypothetical protein
MQADSQAYQARVSLYHGMFWLQFALLAAYVGPLRHSMLVYLDSCPFLPLFTWAHWFELALHVVGSWRAGALPGNCGCGVQICAPVWRSISRVSAAVRRPRLVGGAASSTGPPSAIFQTRSLLSARIAGARSCVITTPRPGAGM